MESYCSGLPKETGHEVDISLVAVKVSNDEYKFKWPNVESMVTNLAAPNLKFIEPKHLPRLTTDTFNATLVIGKLKEAINSNPNFRRNKLFKSFQLLLSSQIEHPLRGTVHCEIELLLKLLLGVELTQCLNCAAPFAGSLWKY